VSNESGAEQRGGVEGRLIASQLARRARQRKTASQGKRFNCECATCSANAEKSFIMARMVV
jgi:hypothetical protein